MRGAFRAAISAEDANMRHSYGARLLLLVCLAFVSMCAVGQQDGEQPLVQVLGYTGKPIKFGFRQPMVVTVHYAESLDPKRFQARLNDEPASEFFHPEPGSTETVKVPLSQGMNRLVFKANSQDYPVARQAEQTRTIKLIRTAMTGSYNSSVQWKGKPDEHPHFDPHAFRFKVPAH